MKSLVDLAWYNLNMIERARTIFGRNKDIESAKLDPLDIVAEYRRVNRIVPKNIERMISLYPNWRHEILTPREVGQLTWYFDKENPNHISWKLTQNGKARRVAQVAQIYLSEGPESLAGQWQEVSIIESMIEALKRGAKLSPLIIVKGGRYPDSPDSSFIDGVHRSLAVVVYALTTPGSNLKVDTYVGRKAALPVRIVRRLA